MSTDGRLQGDDATNTTRATRRPDEPMRLPDNNSRWLFSTASAHLPLLLSTIPITLVFLRVARVSGFEPTTLSILIASVDVFRLALSTIIQWGPPIVLLTAGFIYLSVSRLEEHPPKGGRGDRPSPLATFLLAATLVGCLLMTSPLMLACIALFVAVNATLERVWQFVDRRRNGPSTKTELGPIYLTMVTTFLLVPNSMWLPAEKIDTADGKAIVGYVLEEGEARTTILSDSDRHIFAVPTPSIVTREPCRLGRVTKPLIGYLSGPTANVAKYPDSE